MATDSAHPNSNLPQSEMLWKLRNHRLDFVLKLLSFVSFMLACFVGLSTLQKNGSDRERQRYEDDRISRTKLEVSIRPAIIGTERDRPFLSIEVLLNNKGTVPISPCFADEAKNEDRSGEGLELSIFEYDQNENGFSTDLPLIDWQLCGKERRQVVNKYNILGEYTAFKEETYRVAPGTTSVESVVVPVNRGMLYGIRARFFTSGGGSNAELAYIWVPPLDPSNLRLTKTE